MRNVEGMIWIRSRSISRQESKPSPPSYEYTYICGTALQLLCVILETDWLKARKLIHNRNLQLRIYDNSIKSLYKSFCQFCKVESVSNTRFLNINGKLFHQRNTSSVLEKKFLRWDVFWGWYFHKDHKKNKEYSCSLLFYIFSCC